MAGTDFSHLTNDELIKGIQALNLPDYIRSKAYGVDVRETLAQMIEMTIQLGVNMGLSPDDALLWARKLQETVSQSEFDSWVATLLDGGPSIFMNTLSELQTTYPNGAPGVALVRETDPAKIYVWNGGAWEDFGDYQGIEVKDGTITTSKLAEGSVTPLKMFGVDSFAASPNLFNKNDLIKGGYYKQTGEWVSNAEYNSSKKIKVDPKRSYQKTTFWSEICFYNSNGDYISGLGTNIEFATPANTAYVTLSIPKGNEQSLVLTEKLKWKDTYIPYEHGFKLNNNWTFGENGLKPSELKGVDIVPSSINIFDKNDILENGYYSSATLKWVQSSEFNSTNLIRVDEQVTYRITAGNTEFVFWNKDKVAISGAKDNYRFTAPKGTKYVTASMPKAKTETMMITKEIDWVGFPDFQGDYVPYKEGYKLDDSWKIEDKRSPSDITDIFLRVPTPYDDGSNDSWSTHQATHPSIHQFSKKWNGYKYWMAYTPYPHNNEKLENPCVAVSNDGIKWVEPKVGLNPIYDTPTNGYNSDTHIFYNSDTQKIEVWWREVTQSPLPHNETLIRRTSSDGKTWTEPEKMLNKSDERYELDLVAPSIIWDDGKYKMWVMTQDDSYWHRLMYMTSVDGKTWSEPVYVTSDGARIKTWHTNITKHDGVYYLLNHDDVRGTDIKLATSIDGSETNFTAQEVIIEASLNPWELDGKTLYRAAPLWTDTNVTVIYGSLSQGGDNTLKAQSGRDFNSLKPITAKALDYYNAW